MLRTLKTSNDLKTIPVFVFSASEADSDVQTAYETHANGYIPKPSDLEQLTAVTDAIEAFWVNTVRLHRLPKHGVWYQASLDNGSIPAPEVSE